MSHSHLSDQSYRRDLGDGLVLRWSTSADLEGLIQLYTYVFRNKADDPPSQSLPFWVGDLMSGRHPQITPNDFALVEDTARGGIVAATCLLVQTVEYAGIPFSMGRPEIVASHPEYRNRGLVRAVFELIHARSGAHNHLAQGITGIPYYYRQFGYEYAFDLEGGRSVYFAGLPRLKEGEPEPYTLRLATVADLPFVMELYDRERARVAISTRITEDFWRWVIEGQHRQSGENHRVYLILAAEARPCGYVLVAPSRWGEAMTVRGLAVEPRLPLPAVAPSVMRALEALASSLITFRPDVPPANRIGFVMGRSHPVYAILGDELSHRRVAPYGWYVRVPDLPAFLRHIAPVLEQRLASSALAGYSGETRIDFYRGGLHLVFAEGRLATVAEWRVDHNWGPRGQAGFPPLVFLQLLFGHRSLDELRHAFPDVWAETDARLLLETLFPPQFAWVLHLD